MRLNGVIGEMMNEAGVVFDGTDRWSNSGGRPLFSCMDTRTEKTTIIVGPFDKSDVIIEARIRRLCVMAIENGVTAYKSYASPLLDERPAVEVSFRFADSRSLRRWEDQLRAVSTELTPSHLFKYQLPKF